MKYSYRITKYGTLHGDEWTSFNDIGHSVSEKQYLAIESEYISTVVTVCRCLGVSSLVVSNLELSDEGEPYEEGQEVELDFLFQILAAILREKIWCKLKSPVCEFHFGYDYYMYLVSEDDADICFPKEKSNLHFEVFRSPYLDSQV